MLHERGDIEKHFILRNFGDEKANGTSAFLIPPIPPSEHRNYAPKLRSAAAAVFVARMIGQANKN